MAFPAVNKASNYVKGGGVLRLAVRDATGPLGFFDPGNVPSIELARTVETATHQEARSGTFQTDATFTTSETNEITATVESMTLANFALFLGLDVEERTISAGSVTDDVLRGATRGASWTLGYTAANPEGLRAISAFTSLTIVATAHATSTAVAVGKVVSNTTEAYVYTVAGTTGVSAPTFPTAGGTVSDGTATLKHLGTLVVNSGEYAVSLDPASIELSGLSTTGINVAISRMPAGYYLSFTAVYTKSADTLQRLKPQADGVEYFARFDGQSAQGTPLNFVAPYCTIVGNGTSQWINASEPQNFSITLTALKRDAANGAIIPFGATAEIPWS